MLSNKQRMEKIEKLEALNDATASTKDKLIYRAKYGLDDGILKTFEETGKIFNISGEAVRLIVRKLDKVITN